MGAGFRLTPPLRFAASGVAVAVLASLLATAARAATADRPASFPRPAVGSQVILQKGCTNCHGIAGPGRRQGPDLLRTARGKGAAEVLADMWNHVPQMIQGLPPGERLPALSAGELRDLIGYFSYVNYLGDPGNVRHGQALLAELSCLGCHDLRQRGRIGPALVDPERVASPVGLVTDIWNHYPNMSAQLREKGLAWFAWSGDDISDLSRYLSSLTPIGSPPALQVPGDPEQGARVFTRLGCARCHDPAGGAAWVALVRAANRRSAAENGAALLRHLPRISGHAGNAAQPLQPLAAANMADLLAYLSLAGTELSGGDAAKGKAVFASKRCLGCHALPGTKPGIGPNVVDMPAVADPYEAAALMIEHARYMKIATEIKQVPWPQMQPEELQDLYAFLSKAPRH